ncbi:MAG: hypothetical protein MUP47_08915, partial [Phycisphaerae bacterium]|nr:hypothetical protein [Phycisphaerae bacterium]
MAKSRAMDIVEQHLEKLVLGLCLLLFLVAAGYWGLSSPRAVELPGPRGGTKASPTEVDRQLQDLAKSVMRQVEAREPNVPPAPEYVAEIRRLFSGGQPRHAMGAFGPPAVAISTTEGPVVVKISLTDLVSVMPAPSKPLVKAVHVLPNRQSENQTDELVAHVVAIYPWQELRDAWKEKVGTSGVPYVPTSVGLTVQVRELLPDGRWSSPRNVTGIFDPVVDPAGAPILLPQVPSYDGTNAGYLAQLRSALSASAWQAYLLEPNYWQIWWPGYTWVDWRVNLPENDVTKEAAALLAQTGGTLGASPEGLYPARLPPAPRLIPGRGIRDEEEEERESPAPAVALIEQIPAPVVPTVPEFPVQVQNGKVLVWIHDDSLQPLKVYQYRLGVKFLNPLLGFDNVVTDPS